MKVVKNATIILLVIVFAGCATTPTNSLSSKVSWDSEPQIERGKPNVVVDSIGNIFGIPAKVVLLNSKIENHKISLETEEVIRKYIEDNPKQMKDTKIRLNQFAPGGEFKRLVKNKKIKWWWRIFPGIPTTVLSLGGRLFGGDHYNPYTDTINIYSDVPAVSLHEAGHAVDFSEHAEKGTAGIYAIGRILTPVTLHQEYTASEKAINYLKDTKDREGEKEAYKVLYPAGGTYVGGAVSSMPFASAAGAAVGHIASIVPRYNRSQGFKAYDEAKWSGEIVTNIKADPIAKSLLEEKEARDKLLHEALLKESYQN